MRGPREIQSTIREWRPERARQLRRLLRQAREGAGRRGLEAGEGPGGSAERGRARRAVPRGGDDGGLVWAAGRGGDGGQWATAAQGLPGQSARLRGLRSAVAPSLELGACQAPAKTLPRRPAGGPVVLSLGAMGRREARPWILQPGPGGPSCRLAGQQVQRPHPSSPDKAQPPRGQRPGPLRTHGWHPLCLLALGQGGRGPGSTDAGPQPRAPSSHHQASRCPLCRVPVPRRRPPPRALRSAWSAGGHAWEDGGLEKSCKPRAAEHIEGQPRLHPAPLGSAGWGLGLALSGELSAPAEGRLGSLGPCLGQPRLLLNPP